MCIVLMCYCVCFTPCNVFVLALLQYVTFHTANLQATVVQLLLKSVVSKYIRHGLLDMGMKNNYGVEMAVLKHVILNRGSPIELLTHQITSAKATRGSEKLLSKHQGQAPRR